MKLTDTKSLAALSIIKKLNEAGYKALFAGGCVRDFLLGSIPADFDIATNATPDEVEKIFPKTIPVGKQFGVILVIIEGMQFEVATFRTEGGYQDGRRPGFVKFSGAEEDALRRDFTVNGLFYDPLDKKVFDYVGGQEDIQKKIIRCIGDPVKRFEEDKLRLLRAIRFAVRLNFLIDIETWAEVKNKAVGITAVSKERILEELNKIFLSPRAVTGLQLLADSGLLKALLPQVDSLAIERFNQLKERTIPLIYAVLFLNMSKTERFDRMRSLRCPNEVIQATEHIVELEKQIQKMELLRVGEIEKVLNDSAYFYALALFEADSRDPVKSDILRKKFNDRKNKIMPIPFLGGQDLTSLGLHPGPLIGKILDEAYLQQLEGKLKDKLQAQSWAKTQIQN